MERGGYALERVLVHEDMSEETLAFSALVVRQGEPVTRVRNEGRGGCHVYDWCGGQQARREFESAAAAALPERTFEVEDAFVGTLLQRWAHEQMHPGLDLAAAVQRTQALCEAAVQATRAEIRAAAVALCLAVRAARPCAEVVVLEDSDQGSWLWVEGWREHGSSQVHDLDEDDVWSLASHLYTPAVVQVEGIYTVDRPRRGGGGPYEMDIDTVLRVHRSVLA